MMESITVHRQKAKPSWVFTLTDSGHYEYAGRTRRYRLFFESPCCSYKPIWIGMAIDDTWVTVEKEIDAHYIKFTGSSVRFD